MRYFNKIHSLVLHAISSLVKIWNISQLQLIWLGVCVLRVHELSLYETKWFKTLPIFSWSTTCLRITFLAELLIWTSHFQMMEHLELPSWLGFSLLTQLRRDYSLDPLIVCAKRPQMWPPFYFKLNEIFKRRSRNWTLLVVKACPQMCAPFLGEIRSDSPAALFLELHHLSCALKWQRRSNKKALLWWFSQLLWLTRKEKEEALLWFLWELVK